MTKKELDEVLKKHLAWLRGEPEGKRADLSGSDLSGSDLSGSNLSFSDLSGSDLSGSNLSDSDLSGSNLSGSNLSDSDLPIRAVTIGCIGSAKRQTTYVFDWDKIFCGCFTGTLAEFEAQVAKTHAAGTQFRIEYDAAISMIKTIKGEAS